MMTREQVILQVTRDAIRRLRQDLHNKKGTEARKTKADLRRLHKQEQRLVA